MVMKTIRFGWCLLAVLCLLFSCAKELGPDPEPEVKYVTLSLEASVDLTIDSTKTYMQGTSVKWKSGDKVTIYMDGFDPIVSEPTSVIEADGTYAKFTYQVPENKANDAKAALKYIYYGNGTVTTGAGNLPVSISVPSTQTYAGSDCFSPGENFAFGYMGANATTCTMHNIFGILKVKIKLSDASKSISYVQLVDNGDSYLAGEYALSNISGIPSIAHTSVSPDQSRSLIKKVSSSTSQADSTFYFLVPPGTLSDFSLYVYTGNGIFYGGKTIKLSKPIERAKITTLNLTNFQPSTTTANDLTPANSFIVPAASGTYTIPAQYQGNSSTSVGSAAYAEIMWQGQLSGSVTPFISSAVYFTNNNNKGYIRFNRTGGEGNALVAVKDIDGNILWSWHLWITDNADIAAINTGKVLVNSSSQPVVTIMDRNLGALNIENDNNSQSHGLAYQYGRKDPFMGSRFVYYGGSTKYESFASIFPGTAIWCDLGVSDFNMNYSISHPNIRSIRSSGWFVTDSPSWAGDSKTLYDPCPAGWRVIEKTKLSLVGISSSDVRYSSFTLQSNTYYTFSLANNNSSILFPTSGKSITDQNVSNVGKEVDLWISECVDKFAAYQIKIMLDGTTPYFSYTPQEDTHTTMQVRCQRESTPSSTSAPSLVSSAECEDDQFEVVYID